MALLPNVFRLENGLEGLGSKMGDTGHVVVMIVRRLRKFDW
jgi:hypothetical protein